MREKEKDRWILMTVWFVQVMKLHDLFERLIRCLNNRMKLLLR